MGTSPPTERADGCPKRQLSADQSQTRFDAVGPTGIELSCEGGGGKRGERKPRVLSPGSVGSTTHHGSSDSRHTGRQSRLLGTPAAFRLVRGGGRSPLWTGPRFFFPVGSGDPARISPRGFFSCGGARRHRPTEDTTMSIGKIHPRQRSSAAESYGLPQDSLGRYVRRVSRHRCRAPPRNSQCLRASLRT